MVASRVIPVEEERFPLTASGKVRRSELRERLLAREFDVPGAEPGLDRAAPPDIVDGLRRAVHEVVADVLGHEVDESTPFYEAGLTSPTLVRVRAGLESRLSVRIPTTAVFEHPTVAVLAQYLADRHAVAGEQQRERSPEPEQPGTDQRIAIIGMAGRFPAAEDLEQYWANLRAGVDRTPRLHLSMTAVSPIGTAFGLVLLPPRRPSAPWKPGPNWRGGKQSSTKEFRCVDSAIESWG